MSTPASRLPLRYFYSLLGVIALLGAGIVVYPVIKRKLPVAQATPAVLDQQALERVHGMTLGLPDAPVTLVEFADFQCGACVWFAQNQMASIKTQLIEPGLVRYVYLEYPLQRHRHAMLASRAGRCANEQNRFWEYHDLLYAGWNQWSPAEDALPNFLSYAQELGLDAASFDMCLRSGRFTADVEESRKLGSSVGVRGTPTLFVNGVRVAGVPSFEEVEQLVHAALDARGASAPQ